MSDRQPLSDDTPMCKWNLPGDVGTVLIPESLAVEMEGDETLLAYANGDVIVLRFTCLSFASKGSSSEYAMQEYLQARAAREHLEYQSDGDNGVLAYQKSSEHDGQPLRIFSWDVGSKQTLVIISATIYPQDIDESVVKRVLNLMPRVVGSVKITRTHLVVADEEGLEVTVTDDVVEPCEQEYVPFEAADFAWLDESRQNARALSLKYGDGGELTPASLDVIFGRWMFDEDVEKEEGDIVASALGASFGDYLVEHLNFSWLIVKDSRSAEPAVKHGQVHSIAYPRASVVKRIEDRKSDFFRGLFAAIRHALAELGVRD